MVRFLLTGYAFGQYVGELVEWDEEKRRVVVRTRQNWESAMLGKGHSEPQCQTKCECMRDEYCEFVLEARRL